MVRRCVWGTCNSDERYPERLIGLRLVPFPQPKKDLEKCMRWIKACGRPHDQLNVQNIDGNRNKVVCSKHFIDKNGPTSEYPDPVPACGGKCTPSRQLPKKRHLQSDSSVVPVHGKQQKLVVNINKEDVSSAHCEGHLSSSAESTNHVASESTLNHVASESTLNHVASESTLNHVTSESTLNHVASESTSHEEQSTQTTEHYLSPLDAISMAAEIESLKMKVTEQETRITHLQHNAEEKRPKLFGVDVVLNAKTNHKNLFKHYAGITYVRFLALLSFLIPENFSLNYAKGRKDLTSLSHADSLFLTLIRCRRNFSLADLALRFGLTVQSAGVVFNIWIDHMYFKFGQLSIWPHRNKIIDAMPSDFRRDFPSTLIIIDGTELKTQSPCSVGLQSQLYSDYKGSTTVKCLIGCDPRGSVMFISELFTGSISDKDLTEQSGLLKLLHDLKDCGFIQNGDAIMADKGFTVKDELEKLNIRLNIPPFARGDAQMSPADVNETQKIAKHRIHIERLIAKVKKFRIVKDIIQTSMFAKINKIWVNCCFLTLFQDTFVRG